MPLYITYPYFCKLSLHACPILCAIGLHRREALITAEHKQAFDQDGYVIVKGLFSPEEAEFYKAHYTQMRFRNGRMDQRINDPTANDPLLQWPRLMMMHRHDDVSRQWLLDQRINQCLTGLLGKEPYAVQTMFYFKPPSPRPGASSRQLLPARAAGHLCRRLDGRRSL